jgi:glycosyltransferase involved in cell wall biosynthesis
METVPSRIGIGIITYNRPDYYKKVYDSIPKDCVDKIVIVNDGENVYVDPKDAEIVIHNNKQLGVAKSKNKALEKLRDLGCEHIFLIEDDIIIKNPKVFEEYIKAANSTGIHHLCYEKVAGNEKSLKYVHEQPDGVKIGFYHNPQGAFMYINAQLIKKLGYFDENYINAFEHVDFAYNLIQKKVAPPFWYFPDLYNSEDYLTDIEGSSDNSSITNKEKYQENWQKSATHFTQKWGKFTNEIPDVGLKKLLLSLIHLQTNYSRKKIINQDKKLSIIVPYRDREQALNQLIPALQKYVSTQVENFEIIIVEQNNKNPFNKGLLNNVGFLQSSGDYVCFHDVDLIPEISDYSYPIKPSHISSHCSQFNYINIPDRIMGGVILFTKEHYKQVNGYSNEFNGWGKEDDDLYARCVKENLHPYKHPYGKFFSVPHAHRLNDPKENEYHLANGKRFREYESGILGEDYHKNDGLNKCKSLIKYLEVKSSQDNVTHYLVNF